MIDFNVKDYVKSILPTGPYTVQIKNAEMKVSKNNPDAKFLSLTLEVISAFRTGQKLFDNLNLYHPKEIVERIAREKLASICSALNIENLKNIKDLEGKIIETIVSEDFYNGSPTNRVDKYIAPINKIVSKEKEEETPFIDDDINF